MNKTILWRGKIDAKFDVLVKEVSDDRIVLLCVEKGELKEIHAKQGDVITFNLHGDLE